MLQIYLTIPKLLANDHCTILTRDAFSVAVTLLVRLHIAARRLLRFTLAPSPSYRVEQNKAQGEVHRTRSSIYRRYERPSRDLL